MATIKFQPQNKLAYDKIPLQLKVSVGIREKVMAIPGWQEILREILSKLILENQKPTQVNED